MKTFASPCQIEGSEIKSLRKYLKLSRRDFASLIGVSVKTVEYWENTDKPIKGPIVLLAKLLREQPMTVEDMEIPERKFPLRFLYMFHNEICTLIDADMTTRQVRIKNYTDRVQFRAFGTVEKPTYEEFEEFLKSRCFPETMDKMKIRLKELGLPFYDPLLIIEKTEGRMAEDDFWIKVV